MTKVYIHSPRWFVRPRNTDWRYARFSIPRVTEFVPDCTFWPARSLSTVLEANGRYVKQKIKSRLWISATRRSGSTIDVGELMKSGSEIVFTHDEFPANGASIPIVWQNSILDPQMMMSYGMPTAAFEELVAFKRDGFSKAAAVQVSTVAEKERLCKWFPELAHKFVAVPFFLPDLKSIEEADFRRKLDGRGVLRCLFVGHEARRKGLARVYDAMARLPERIRRRVHLTVVSKQIGGSLKQSALTNLDVYRELPYSRVMQLMAESDVLVMPSLFESYGLVYLEAMAQGTIPLVPDWEVQREIVDYGRAGLISVGSGEDIGEKLEHLCDDDEYRRQLATSARSRFQLCFAAPVVASQYGMLFRNTKAEFPASQW